MWSRSSTFEFTKCHDVDGDRSDEDDDDDDGDGDDRINGHDGDDDSDDGDGDKAYVDMIFKEHQRDKINFISWIWRFIVLWILKSLLCFMCPSSLSFSCVTPSPLHPPSPTLTRSHPRPHLLTYICF